MQRHLDDLPGLNSNSNSESTSSNLRDNPVDTTQASDKPLSRQPPDLIQETVHALGGSQGTEMQSGIQFSVPSGYQSRVVAETILSQGSLSHSQPPSTVHHSLSIQAHANPQIVHPIQSNSEVGDRHQTALEGHQMQFQRPKIEDALSYLDQVKNKLDDLIYNEFLDIMREFKSQSIDTPGVTQRVSNLFRGHPELILGFNSFLPQGYSIEVQPDEQVQVSIPETNVVGGQEPTSLTIHPTGPLSTTVHPVPQTSHTERDA